MWENKLKVYVINFSLYSKEFNYHFYVRENEGIDKIEKSQVFISHVNSFLPKLMPI